MNTMIQIPEQLLHFPKKAIIACLRHDSAQVYRVWRHKIEQLHSIETPLTSFHYSDNEGFELLTSPSTPHAKEVGRVTGHEHHNKEHYLHVYLNFFAHELANLKHRENAEEIVIFTPKEMFHLVEDKLPFELKQHARILKGNFYDHPILEIIQRLPQKDGLYIGA